jgi:hypothetical protein
MNLKAAIYFLGFIVMSTSMLAHNPEKPKASCLKGQVLDAITGEPLTGARISIANTQQVVISDEEGYFKLDISENPSSHLITISLVSFQTISLSAADLAGGLPVMLKEK